jgi:hypothetical protein
MDAVKTGYVCRLNDKEKYANKKKPLHMMSMDKHNSTNGFGGRSRKAKSVCRGQLSRLRAWNKSVDM